MKVILYYVSLLVLVTPDITEGCDFNGVTYLPGDKYNMDPCTWCTCQDDNTPLCMAAMCGGRDVITRMYEKLVLPETVVLRRPVGSETEP